jgi:predicted transcriptional regulator
MNNQELVERLDILISLLTPKFEPSKYNIKGLGLDILKLADADNTVEDMMKKLRKKRPIIDQTLSKLRTQGLIKSISKNSKTYYIRIS